MKKLISYAFAVGIALSSAGLAFAQTAAPTLPSSAAMAEGEVKKVDKEAGKLTIKHGELKNLEMPGMTMIFRVKDPEMLNKVKVGDQVSFFAEKLNGQITVTQLEMKR